MANFRRAARAVSGAEAAILLGGKMATQPPGGGVVARSSASPPKKSFWSCFSCRMVTGGGLAAAALWVHLGVRQKRPGNLYDIFRLAFAIGLYSGAIVIIFDPVQPK